MLELWHFTWVYLSVGTIIFCPVTLTLEFDPFFENVNLVINLWTVSTEQWVLELGYFTWVFIVLNPFRGCHYFLHCDLDLGVWPIFVENFNLANNFWTVSARALLNPMSISSDNTGIMIFFLVTLAIFGIGHYRGQHISFLDTAQFIQLCGTPI